MLIESLLIIIVILLLILIFIKKKESDIGLTITKVLNDSGMFVKIGELSGHAQNLMGYAQSLTNYTQDLKNQAKDINDTLDKRVGELTNQAKDINETLDKKVGELTTHTEDIRQSHKSIEQMLRVPKERAPFGELSLEIILSDQLPPDMFGIRQKILDGKIPDAHIKSTVGLICIDSKFPLDNYAKMMETNDYQEKESFKRQFIKDVEGHLNKVSYSYVCPQKGSAEFAFAYIPSEGVYYFLMTEAYQMLYDYTKKGVQIASPLILSSKIELIKTGVQAKKLSEDTEKVRNDIIRLSQQFRELDELWRLFYGTHFSRATVKADEIDQEYKKLREEFGKISRLADNKQIQDNNKQIQSNKQEKPILTIPANSGKIQSTQSTLSNKDKIIKETRIVGGKPRKVEVLNGNIIRVFDIDGSIIEDRSDQFDDILHNDTICLEKDGNYEEFKIFYESFLKEIESGISSSKTGDIAAPINSIVDDAKKMVKTIDGRKEEFLNGMNTYFDSRGIKTYNIDDKYISFKKKIERS